MGLQHPRLVKLLRKAYSAERAAALAYIGHARSLSDPQQQKEIQRIEQEEWGHRQSVGEIMQVHDVGVSKYYEIKYLIIGRLISLACHVIGWFMPFYFAGRLESGNVCEYFRMLHYFEELGISQHHELLFEMGNTEKEHELYFLEKLKSHRLLPLFEKVFSWGNRSFNDVDLEAKYSLEKARAYCQKVPK